jgi:adenine phosphoribosyltransferase
MYTGREVRIACNPDDIAYALAYDAQGPDYRFIARLQAPRLASYGPVSRDAIAAIESRGYLLGMSLADALDIPFIQIRKSGKLPGDCVRIAYSLEYGAAEIEVQSSAFAKGSRVLIVDDVLATGGTMRAAVDLVRHAGATVAKVAVISEIGFLNGRENLSDVEVHSLLQL